jgi:hypothetical protein
MRWSFDRTGFPVLEPPQLGWAVQLWPVTKVQYERFLAEPAGPGDEWYETILSVSPRVPILDLNEKNYESAFLGGVLPEEALSFARWLGPDFELPKEGDWRAMDQELMSAALGTEDLASLRADPGFHPQGRRLLEWCLKEFQPETWGQLALLRDGLLEWVALKDGKFGGLGSTRPTFLAVIVNPQRDEPVTPVRPEERKPYFGFRLLRPL